MASAADIRVMIVDDDAEMRQLVRRMLERMGFTQIYAAKDGAEGLPLALSQHPDLIIADYEMPTMHGLQLLKAVRQEPALERTGFIMLSGVANEDVVRKAGELGADGYLAKPVTPADLKQMIDTLFRDLTGTGIDWPEA
ncbi:response regulator [Sphingomonas parva]|uniref:Response regulator n=1 Tax=Sphingomonas parva TaxID=2555898 RepID=A0A4Y8ZMX6_9SPHN|nr:response regulator [Sphingomonas parva]TFI56807.1 response regulator [Sphingomonas parva]